MVRTLVGRVDVEGTYPCLVEAAAQGNVKATKLLLTNNANVDSADASGTQCSSIE